MRILKGQAWALVLTVLLGLGATAQTVDLYPVLTIGDFPRVGVPLTIEVDVVSGDLGNPTPAPNAIMQDVLPPEFTLLSCTVANYERMISTGWLWPYDPSINATISVTNYGNTVECNAGLIQGTYIRPIFIEVLPTRAGVFANQIWVSSPVSDSRPGNNYLQHAIQVHGPSLFVLGGASVPEDSSSNAVFTVYLSPPSDVPVTVDYSTTNGTATAGEDYQAVSGTLTFVPGVTNLTVSVPVLDDQLAEAPSQSFTLKLSNAVNADISDVAQFDYVLDNEPALRVSIGNAADVLEGWLVTNLDFPIALSSAADVPINVDYTVTGAITDSGTLTVPAGATNFTLSLQVVGNLTIESNRIAQVSLSTPYPIGELGQSAAQGLIIDDDGLPGHFDHMTISQVPLPQIVNRPFTVTVRMFDYFNNPASNDLDQVEVVAYRWDNHVTTFEQVEFVTNFVNGVGTATITYLHATTNASITAWKKVGTYYATASTSNLRILPPPALSLSLPGSATEGDGLLTTKGRVTIPGIDGQEVNVPLDHDKDALVIPDSVTIPAGQTFVEFDVAILDNQVLEGTHLSYVFASSPGYSDSAAAIKLFDNETAVLSLQLPEVLSEAKGLETGTARVYASAAPSSPIQVNLLSGNTARLVVPSSVWIQAGQTTATFNVSVPNNAIIDPEQMVSVTAHVPNWTDAVASTRVLDDDANVNTHLMLGNYPPMEGLGPFTNGLDVRLGGVTSNAVTVTLTCSEPSRVVVPGEVVIPAGQQHVAAEIAFPDNDFFDGSTNVTIIASAPGFAAGTNTFSVFDNDIHRIAIGPISNAQTSGVPFRVTISAYDINDAPMSVFRGAVDLKAMQGDVVLPSSPTVISNFLRSWNGTVTIKGWGTSVQLVATAPQGITQRSAAFDVASPAWADNLRITRWQLGESGIQLFYNSTTGVVYQLQHSTNIGGTWMPVDVPQAGTGTEQSLTVSNSAPMRWFRLWGGW